MWTRKSDDEIRTLLQAKELEKEKAKKSLRRPLIFGGVFGLVFMVAQYFGYRGGASARGVYLFSSETGFSWRTLYFGAGGFLIFFCIALYRQKRGIPLFNSPGDDALLCGECQEPSAANAERRCPCGGRLEPFEYYTWEE